MSDSRLNTREPVTTHDSKYLLFSLSDAYYALNLAQVAEIGDPPLIWPVPLAPDCIRGAFSFHGDICSVLDLSALFGLPAKPVPGKMVVLRHKGTSLALLVDEISGIFSHDVVECPPEQQPPCTGATLQFPDGAAATLLDGAEIVGNVCRAVQNVR